MNIAIDGRFLAKETSGFKTYSYNLIKGLAEIDPDNEYYVYLDEDIPDLFFSNYSNFHKVVLRKLISGFTWKQLQIPLDAISQKRNLDIIHFLGNSPSFTSPCKLVYTIHDLSFRYFPDMISRRDNVSLRLQMPLGAKRAEKIITSSESAKRDICRYLNVNAKKVKVIPHGVDAVFSPVKKPEFLVATKQKYKLPDRFVLYLGSFMVHKNLPILLEAYRHLPNSLQKEIKLIFAGGNSRNFMNIKKLVHEMSLESNVIFLGQVPDQDLPALLSLANLFVFPSLYEGFGLPVLEAMACGLPVVASNSSSLPEVVGEAGILVEPNDIHAWSQAIEQVMTNPELSSQMSANGLDRAKNFNWQQTAKQTLNVYRELE